MVYDLDTGQVHSGLGSKEQVDKLLNGASSFQNIDIACSYVNNGLNGSRVLLSSDECPATSPLTFENHGGNSIERVECCNGAPGSSQSLLIGDNSYHIEDARHENKASFFPGMEVDPLMWIPSEPEDMEVVIDIVANDDDDDQTDAPGWGRLSSQSKLEGPWSCYSYKEERQMTMIDTINGQLKILASHCLASAGIYYSDHDSGDNWLNIVTSLSWKAALLVKPDPGKGRAMDPGAYVKVKCIASGSPSESQLIKGLVFKKSAAHKNMPTKFRNAKLLLLKGCLGNSTNGLSSFVSMGQEKDNSNTIIDMIEISHPNVVLVEKSVSRDIQETLLARGITVVFDMKLPRLERIALCTDSQIFPNGDIAVVPDLKHCDSFHFEKFVEKHNSTGEAGKRPVKTLMFLEGCPRPLGCTVLLKGANNDELKKIKHALHRIVLEAYHLKLETSFFDDQRAFFSDINLLKKVNDMSTNEIVTSVENDASLSNNSLGYKLSCAPLPYALDIPISDGSVMKPINGGRYNSSECAQASLGPSIDSMGDRTVHGNVPGNCNFVQTDSNVSQSVERIPGNCLLDQTTESISSCSGFKENENDHDGGVMFSPLVKNSDCNKQLKDNVHEKPDSEFHIDSTTGHFSDITQVTEIQIVGSNKDLKLQNKDDVNYLLDSQSILVLTSIQCFTKQAACEECHLSRINYYGNFDVSLGRYLQDILLNQKYTCSCGEPSEAHIYRYSHQNGSLTALVSHLPNGSVLPGEAQGNIWMWTRCLKCTHNKGVQKASQRVLMSSLSCGLSFGKFLDLSFANHSAANLLSRCGHLLHKECLRFFGLGSKVAMFRYSLVEIYTACKPQLFLEFYNQKEKVWIMKEAKDILAKGELLFVEVANVLKEFKAHFACSIQKQTVSSSGLTKQINEIEDMLKQDKAAFEASLVAGLNQSVQQGKNVNEILGLNWLIKELCLLLYVWDRRLHFLLQHVEDFSCNAHSVDSLQMTNVVVSCNNVADGNVRGQGKIAEEPLMQVPIVVGESLSADGDHNSGNCRFFDYELNIESAQFSEELTPTFSDLYISEGGNSHGDASPEIPDEEQTEMATDQVVFRDFVEEPVPILDHIHDEDSNPVSIVPLSYAEDVNGSGYISNKECCSSNEKPILSQQPCNSSSGDPEQWIWGPFSELQKDYIKDLHDGSFHKFQFINSYTPIHLSGVGKLIPRDYSLHFAVDKGGGVISLAENEISSIIACALASYKDQYGPVDVIAEKEVTGELDQAIDTVSLESEGAYQSSPDENKFNVSMPVDQLIASDNLHPEITLVPFKIAGRSKYSVICIYAKEFCTLRKKWFLSELAYISSLSRCNKWDAQGGKSKAFFAKTMDERFIIKQIKKTELDSFVKFGPQYFDYISFSVASGSQTCLAKILGIYQVRQVRNGKEIKTDLMVMENLLFGRNITRKYDLKGAAFSRYVSDVNVAGKVLLDENFIEDMHESPIYVGGRSKRLLERAIWNDTSFLTSINVMDYSLLVGVDRDRRELVFGIIDYVRQYTWDKQLETWVKSSLVLPKNALPTVISPKEYKKRFRKFLSKHIVSVPDAWSCG